MAMGHGTRYAYADRCARAYITVLCTVCGLHGRAPRDAIRYDAMPPPAAAAPPPPRARAAAAAAAARAAAARAAQRSILIASIVRSS
jgi:hypothetical protein